MKIIYFNQSYYSDEPSTVGEDVVLCPHPWSAFKNRFARFICHIVFSPKINRLIRLPFKKAWVKKVLKKLGFNSLERFVIIVNAHYYQLFRGKLFDYVKHTNEGNRVFLSFSDKVVTFLNLYQDFPKISEIKKFTDVVLTYNTNDAKTFDVVLERPCIPIFPNIPNLLGDYRSDVFFIGKKKDRLDVLHSLYTKLTNLGFECDFYIYGVEDNEKLKGSSIHYNTPLKYRDVLEHCKKTKAIVNIVQGFGEGITVRDYEAAYFGKYYITNNFAVKDSPLFAPSQIIFLDEIDKRIDEIRKPIANNVDLCLYGFVKWKEFIECLAK